MVEEDIEYRLEHVGITVDNLDKAVEWYKSNFGFEEMRSFKKSSLQIRGATLQLKNFLLEIICPYPETGLDRLMSGCREPEELKSLLRLRGVNHLALGVNNLKESYDRLKKGGVELTTEILESRYFFCRDNDGVLIEVRQKT